MDWTGCELIEVVPGATPMVKGANISADALVAQLQQGAAPETIAAQYPGLSLDTVITVLAYAVERLAWDTKTLVDWTGCVLVERVPGRCAGAPTIVGTRIPPDIIAEYHWAGSTTEEIRTQFPGLSLDMIAGLIEFVKRKELSAA